MYEKRVSPLEKPKERWPQDSINIVRKLGRSKGEPMCALRHERDIYEVDVRSGAYGERRSVIMPVAALVLVLLGLTGLFLRNLVSGYWFLFAVFAASALLLMTPILARRMKRD